MAENENKAKINLDAPVLLSNGMIKIGDVEVRSDEYELLDKFGRKPLTLGDNKTVLETPNDLLKKLREIDCHLLGIRG